MIGRFITFRGRLRSAAIALLLLAGAVAHAQPIAVDDDFVAPEDNSPLAGDVAADNGNGPDDPGVTPSTFDLVTDVSSGTLSLNSDGTFTYTYPADFDGSDSFTYTITDSTPNTSAPATVTIVIDRVPDSFDDLFTPKEDASPLAGNVTADNGSGADDLGDGLGSVNLVTDVSTGTLLLNSDGSFTYTYPADFDGSDSFTYQVLDADGDLGNTATVTIDIDAVPDARADNVTVPEDSTGEINNVLSDNGSGADDLGDGLSAVTQEPSPTPLGTVNLQTSGIFDYTPPADFSGTDTFAYRVTDTNGDSDTALVTVIVDPVPDPVNDTFTPDEDGSPLTGNVTVDNGSGADDLGSGLGSVNLVTDVSNGSLSLSANGDFTYTYATDFDGSDSFIYSVTDSNGDTGPTATVSINVNPIPDLQPDSFTPDEGSSPLTGNVTADNGNGADDLGDGLGTVNLVVDVSSGALVLNSDGSFTYTYATDFDGSDSFTYSVTDASGDVSTSATVSININSIPDPVDDGFAIVEDGTLNGNVLADNGNGTDDLGDGLGTVNLGSDVSNGTLNLNASGAFSYSPDANFNGSDSFTYTITDTDGDTGPPASVTIAIDPAPDPTADSFSPKEDASPLTGNVTVDNGGGIDDLGSGLGTVDLVSDVSTGTLALSANGDFTFTYPADFDGTDTFVYSVTDANGDTGPPATVTINVDPIPDTEDDLFEPKEDASPLLGNVVVDNGSGADDLGDGLGSINLVTDVSSGTLLLNSDGTFSYLYPADFDGVDSFTYTATDANGDTGSLTTVVINVDPIPDPVDDTFAPKEDALTFSGTVTADNGAGADDLGDGLGSISVQNDVTTGSLALASDGSFTYTYPENFDGTDGFTYLVTDANGDVGPAATVTFNIDAVPDPVDDAFVVDEDASLSGDVTADNGAGVDDLGTGLATINLTVDVANGSLALNPDGSFNYSPNADFDGADSFSYTVTDTNGDTGPGATVNIDIDPVPDGRADAFIVDEDTRLTGDVTADNGGGVDDLGDGVGAGSFQVATAPALGVLQLDPDSGTFSYDPALNDVTPVFFEYTITDVGATPDVSAPVRVDITIDPVPDPTNDVLPIAPALALEDGVAFTGNVDVDNGNGVDDRGDDAAGQANGITLVTDVTNGTLLLQDNGDFTYDSNDNYFGPDSFQYQVTDDNGDVGVATVDLTITPVNDQPSFGNLPPFEAGAACEPQTLVPGFMPQISAGPPNESDQTLTTELSIVVSQPAGAVAGDLFSELPAIDPLTGTLSYVGQAAGLMQVTVQLRDSGGTANGGVELSDSQLFLLTLDGSPQTQDDFDFVDEDAAVVYDLRGASACASPLDLSTVQVIDPPENGTTEVDPETGEITYRPNADFFSASFFEPDSFVYRIADENGDTSSATVSVLVRAVPDARDDGVFDVLGDSGFTTPNVLANDESGGSTPAPLSDVDPGLTDTVSAQGGTVQYNGDGTFLYTPPSGFVGMDSFSYGLTRTEDATGQVRSDTATVMLSVFQASAYTLNKFWPNTPYPIPFRNPDSFVVDNLGFVYVRDRDLGRIFKLSPSAQLVGSFEDTGAGAGVGARLAVDGERNVYSVTIGGGPFTLTRYTSDGQELGCLNAAGSGGCAGLPAGVSLSAIRDLEFAPDGTLLLIAGSGDRGVHRLGLDLTYQRLEIPEPVGSSLLDIAAGADGVIYTLTAGASLTIDRYTAMGTFLGSFPGTVSSGDSYNLKFGVSAGEGRVALLTNDTNRVNLAVFSEVGTQITGVDLAGLLESNGLIFDRFGNLLIGVPGRFARYTLFGQLVEEVGFSGTTPGRFDRPLGLDVTAAGDLIVADTNNARVQFFDDVSGQLLSVQNLNRQGMPAIPADVAADPTGGNFFIIEDDRLLEYAPGTPSAALLNDAPLPCSPSHLVAEANGDLIFDCPAGLLYRMPAAGVPTPLVVVPGTSSVLDLSVGNVMGQPQLLGLAVDGGGTRFLFQVDLISAVVATTPLTGSLATNAVALELLADETLAVAEDDFDNGPNDSRVVRVSLLGTEIDQPAGPGTGPLGVAEVGAIRRLDAQRFAVLDARLGRLQVVEATTATFDRRAVVVAGGGPYAGNNLWDATQVNANLAYRTLLFRGYRKEDIIYLSADDLNNADIDSDGVADDIDGFPTVTAIESAIMSLAGADEAVVYLADHGDTERFRVNGLAIPSLGIAPETLDSTTLGSWLDNLDTSGAPGQLTVIYEACESGSFLDNLESPSPARVVITTTNTGQDAKFISQGYLSFSAQFWSEIFDGGSVGEAFEAASAAVGNQTIDQDPQVDVNGISNGGDLGQLNYFIGGDTAAVNDSPGIENASLQLSGALDVVVSNPQDVARAFAVVRPPMLTTGASDNPVIGLPEVELSPPLSGCGFASTCTFSGIFDGFVAEGMYSVEVLLRDTSGYLTRFEVPLTANITNPPRRRAVVVAGFSDNPTEQQRIENAAAFVYRALLQQGYQDDPNGIEDIRFLSAGSSGIPGVDQQLSRSALEFTFTQWATEGLKDLTVYFVGRTQGSSFFLGAGDLLTARDMDAWFDDLQEGLEPVLTGTLLAMFEGNTAGQLLPDLAGIPGRPRIILSSTGLAENAMLFADTDPLFTRHYWTGVANGASAGESFDIAARAVAALSTTQMPMLDDGGGVAGENDGRANGPMDGLVARAYNIGPGVRQAGNAPLIGGVSDDIELDGTDTTVLRATDVSSTQQSPVMNVFAAISPPSPFAPQQFVDLQPVGGSVYEASFDGFDLGGRYQVALFAVDDDENISVQQELSVVRLDAPDGYEVDDTAAQASVLFIDADQAQFHSLHVPADEDWVRFFGRADATYEFSVVNQDASDQLQLRLELRSDQDTVLFTSQGLAGGDVGLSVGPGLVNTLPEDEEYFLRVTALSGGGAGAFYTLRAFQPLGDNVGVLEGRVVDGSSGAPIPGAVITSGGLTVFSNQVGEFILANSPNSYSLDILANTFQPLTDTYALAARETTTRVFGLVSATAGSPALQLRAPIDVTTASATLLADVDPQGDLTDVIFRLRPVGGEFGPELSASSVSTPLLVGRQVDGLDCSSSFEFEASASNSSGSVTDGPLVFDTLECVDPPVLSNIGFDNVSDQSARIQIDVDSSETAQVVYRLRPAGQEFGDFLSAGNVAGTGVQVTVDLDNLICETVFDFQFRATNTGGETLSTVASLTTESCVAGIPEVTTGSADQITETSARLNALVDGNGGVVDVQFDFGLTTAYGNVVLLVGVNAAGGQVPVSANISGLVCGTEYRFRVRATNAQGQRVGFDRSFETTVCPRDVNLLLVDDDNNAPDVAQTLTNDLAALGVTAQVLVTNGDADEPAADDLQGFDVVLWATGQASDVFTGPASAAETAIQSFLDAGGCFAISSEGWLNARGQGSDTPTPLMRSLGVASALSDVNPVSLTGQAPAFEGLGPYDLSAPQADVLEPQSDANVIFDGNGGGAAVLRRSESGDGVYFGFDLAALASPADRQDVLERVLDFCESRVFENGFEEIQDSTAEQQP
ncbi:MAG: Ig-like domain-containing protein [Pseudomonadota bacterium]